MKAYERMTMEGKHLNTSEFRPHAGGIFEGDSVTDTVRGPRLSFHITVKIVETKKQNKNAQTQTVATPFMTLWTHTHIRRHNAGWLWAANKPSGRWDVHTSDFSLDRVRWMNLLNMRDVSRPALRDSWPEPAFRSGRVGKAEKGKGGGYILLKERRDSQKDRNRWDW